MAMHKVFDLARRLRQIPLRELASKAATVGGNYARLYRDNTRRFMYVTLIRSLRSLANTHLTPFNALAVFITRHAPLSERWRDAIYDHAISGSRSARHAFRHRNATNEEQTSGLFRWSDDTPLNTSLEDIQDNAPAHLFLTPGASLAALNAAPELLDRPLKIYSFDNRTAEASALKLGERVSFYSLRELFPEISDAAEKLRMNARTFAARAVDNIFDGKLQPSLADAVRLVIEDDVNHRLSLLWCIRNAVADLDTNDLVVIMPGDDGMLPVGFQSIASARRGANLHALYAHVSPSKYATFQQELAKQTAPTTKPSPFDTEKTLLRQASKAASHTRVAQKNFASECAKAAHSGGPMIVFDPISRPYLKAVNALAAEAGRLGDKPVILTLAPASREALPDATNIGALFTAHFPVQPMEDAVSFANVITHRLEDLAKTIFDEAPSLAARETGRTISTKLPTILAMYELSKTVAAQIVPRTILTTTGRSWRTRLFANMVKQAGGKIIDFQVLNILPQRKYLAPIADTTAVINETQAELHRDFLGVPDKQIKIVGSPADEATVIASNGAKTTILFASQLISEEIITPALDVIIDHLQSNVTARLIIKTHPRETDARIAAYQQKIDDAGLTKRAQIFSEGEAASFFPQTKLCVTFYSNVGRQAAGVGLPVITPFLTDWRPPTRLDTEGLATAVLSAKEFRDFLKTPLKLQNQSSKNPFNSSASATTSLLDLAAQNKSAHRIIIAETASDLNKLKEENQKTLAVLLAAEPKQSVSFQGTQAETPAFRSETAAIYREAGDEASTIADAAAERIIEHLGEGAISETLTRNKNALSLMIRADIFEAVKRRAFLRTRLSEVSLPATITTSSANTAFQMTVLKACRAGNKPRSIGPELTDASIYFFGASPAVQPSSNEPQQNGYYIKAKEPTFSTIPSTAPLDPERKTLVLSTAWGLKTVPPSTMPILQRFADDGYQILALNLSANGLNELAESLASTGAQHHVMQPTDLISKNTLSTVGQTLSDNDIVDTALRKAVTAIAKSKAGWIAGWENLATRYLSHSCSFSLACPGRQWHADVAHDAATNLSRLSVTLQNAYMFRGYTYTQPRGQLLTAIDERQRDVFIEGFGVSPDTIFVTGCPRFDPIAKAVAAAANAATPNDEQTGSKRTILFATQPGLEDIAVQTASDLVLKLSDDIRLRIKLHPRTSKAQEEKLRAKLPSKNVDIVRDTIITEEIAAADIILTAYSNAGLEAAIAGKPVIYTTFEKWYTELGATDCGLRASNPEETTRLVSDVLEDPTQCLAAQTAFLNRNAALRDGASSDHIVQLINEQINILSQAD